MPSRDVRLRIQDILDAIAKIEAYTRGMTFDQFCNNNVVMDAVLMNFAIVGEAAGSVPVEIQDRYPDIEWRKMREMRHVLIHVYFKVSPKIVWDTIQVDLSPLVPRLVAVLQAEHASS